LYSAIKSEDTETHLYSSSNTSLDLAITSLFRPL